jgi:hypothetical protein
MNKSMRNTLRYQGDRTHWLDFRSSLAPVPPLDQPLRDLQQLAEALGQHWCWLALVL